MDAAGSTPRTASARHYSDAMEGYRQVSTGHAGLDSVTAGLRLGDNVVWQTDDLRAFAEMVDPFVTQARSDGRTLVYIRFGEQQPLLADLSDVHVHHVDPTSGFENFATAVHRIISDEGAGAFYVFDPLTELLSSWRSDLMVMNFFKITCPYLYELDTVAYFCLVRGAHSFDTVAGIRETTQLLLDLYRIGDDMYLHALKVWSRYSPTMFFPHLLRADEALPVTSSEETARLFGRMTRQREPLDRWRALIDEGWDAVNSGDEARQTRVHRLLVKLMIGRDSRMSALASRHLSLEDLLAIADRKIGTGFIGGKSVGMLTSRAIAAAHPDLADRLEAHDSFYLGSDLFFTYIIANGWWKDWMAQKSPEGYYPIGEKLCDRLARGQFPPVIRERFLRLLEYFGQSPIIVRSSSLLEDNYGNAFAGKYESTFCANQGTPEERHRAFEQAVRDVYASAMSTDALAYREHRDLDTHDEQMAVLVQRVSGDHHGDLFFPHAGGVAHSRNLYVYDPAIDPNAGALRIVVGLGTRAVDRVAGDYARIVTLDDVRRSPVSAEDASRYSQRQVDVLSLSENALVTRPFRTMRDLDIDWTPFVSPDEGQLRRLRELGRPAAATPVVIDFAGLLADGFGAWMARLLTVLSAAYDYPVDVEFTVNLTRGGDFRVGLVQCRPLQTRGVGVAVNMPDAQPSDSLIATQGGFMGGNVMLPIDHVVLVRPEAYLGLGQPQRYAVARQLGAVTKALEPRRLMLIGPGRWGTSTTALGVPVSFAEIRPASVLVEVTDPAAGFSPELSFGSHFFQDLVEQGIFFVALHRDRPSVVFNPDRVLSRPNELLGLFPDAGDLADVIHVAGFTDLVLYSDIVSQRLVCV